MKPLVSLGTVLLGLSSSLANAAAIPSEKLELAQITPKRDVLEERQSPVTCIGVGHTANTRHCWAPGFSKVSAF